MFSGRIAAGLTGAFSAALLATGAEAGARQDATVLMEEHEGARKSQEELGYASAVVSGDLIFLSGVVAGLRPGETDLKAAYERVYRQIGRTLERAGASFDDVIDLSSFHADVEAQIPAMSAVHKQYIKPPFPAWTAIGVSRLLGNGITEIKITARRPAGAGQR